jgi:hypothetical protein
LAALSDVVQNAGEVDMAEGAALLAASEDVGMLSVVVGLMSAEDLGRGLEFASMAREFWAVSDVEDLMEMPVLSDFLESRGENLQANVVYMILQSASTRSVTQLKAEIGE